MGSRECGNGVIVRRRSTVPPSRRHTEHTSRRIMLSNLVQTVWVWRRSWSLSAGAQCLGVGDGLIEAARKQITLLCDVMQGRQARHPYVPHQLELPLRTTDWSSKNGELTAKTVP